ncbi:MAG: TPM domain-containing protein [Muribaculaceae bacterium]|nr:TPM domain-containing protein [Muribaculaceae bacterium]
MQLDNFISKHNQGRVVAAIGEAEKMTSGEIRVHLTPKCGDDVMRDAIRTFNRLGMYKTRHRNGVLIFVAFESRKFAIIGDSGIDEVVSPSYWDEEKELLLTYFKNNDPATGLCSVIARVGAKLKGYFPIEDDDVNELTNDISYEE